MGRAIDEDVIRAKLTEYIGLTNGFDRAFNETPTIDAVEVVRCYECKHKTYCYSEVAMTNKSQTADIYKSVNFCSYGVRETDHE